MLCRGKKISEEKSLRTLDNRGTLHPLLSLSLSSFFRERRDRPDEQTKEGHEIADEEISSSREKEREREREKEEQGDRDRWRLNEEKKNDFARQAAARSRS